ncbi:hypothetical protein DL96DRAFT_1607994 [Flagelloscypha sp. PMI_526]|nr:hypothetical protein DL96DRAFT_1607994 [Flagelloscypha sp. PMI_526]
MSLIIFVIFFGFRVIYGAGQCLQNTTYLEIRSQSGETFGKVARNSLNNQGGLTVTTSNDTSEWLQVERWDTCNGNPNMLRITNSPNPYFDYISLVSGVQDCTTAAMGTPGAWTIFAATAGSTNGPYPTPTSIKSVFAGTGSAWNIVPNRTVCAETMIWDFSGTVLNPKWKNPAGDLMDLVFSWDALSRFLDAAQTLAQINPGTPSSRQLVDLVPVRGTAVDSAPPTNSSTAAPSGTSNKTSSSHVPIGPIVGGVVGGILALLLLAALLKFWHPIRDWFASLTKTSTVKKSDVENAPSIEEPLISAPLKGDTNPYPTGAHASANNLAAVANESRTMF